MRACERMPSLCKNFIQPQAQVIADELGKVEKNLSLATQEHQQLQQQQQQQQQSGM